mgnify:CR=1 FL=1
MGTKMKAHKFTNKQKIAALLLSFGEDLAAQILRNMNKNEVQEISRAMQQLSCVESEAVDELVGEFYEVLTQKDRTVKGGREVAKKFIKRAFREDVGTQYIEDLELANPRMDCVHMVDSQTLANIIQKEHPQTIAVIVAFCDGKKAGEVLFYLPQNMRTDLLMRIANLDSVAIELVNEIDFSIQEEIKSLKNRRGMNLGGQKSVAAMLAKLDNEKSEALLESLKLKDPELAESLKAKMFVFTDLVKIPDQDFQLIMKSIPQDTLRTALILADSGVREKFFKNMSKRASQLLMEDLDARKPVKKSAVYQCQNEILQLIQELDKEGKISLNEKMV